VNRKESDIMEQISIEELNDWITKERKTYKKELKHWKPESSFYYAYSEKLNTLDRLEKFIKENKSE
jgi:hypothetical protein